jgi:hypothetical protein
VSPLITLLTLASPLLGNTGGRELEGTVETVVMMVVIILSQREYKWEEFEETISD